jgi:hypothetical protein
MDGPHERFFPAQRGQGYHTEIRIIMNQVQVDNIGTLEIILAWQRPSAHTGEPFQSQYGIAFFSNSNRAPEQTRRPE